MRVSESTHGERHRSAVHNNKETPLDVVSGEWTQGLADFYTAVGTGSNQQLDQKPIEKYRPTMAALLREHAKQKQ